MSAFAADWAKADVDKAISVVDKGKSDIVACLKDFKTTIQHEVEQRDLNKDGINELVITSMPAAFGEGPSQGAFIACFGDMGTISLMISDGKGGWADNIGFNVHSLEYSDRPDSPWPDITLTGKGFCFPIYRYYKEQYTLWKTCDDGNNLVFADATLDWAVPHDFGVDTHKPAVPVPNNLEGADFSHNDSIMYVNTALGVISYKMPKRSIAKTVRQGDVMFQGKPWENQPNARIEGTAFTFKKGCEPAPYRVTGNVTFDGQGIVLEGAAPVRDKKSCAIKGYSRTSGNAHLEFWFAAPQAPAWAGNYAGECRGNDRNVQCFMDIDNDGGMLDVNLIVTGPMGDDIRCRLTGKLPISAGTRAEGRLNDTINARFRLEGGDVTVSGIPMEACGVKLSGRYRQFGD